MGHIVRINSFELIEKFLKKPSNISDCIFILVSDDITTNNTYDNIISVKNLMPDKESLMEYEGSCISEQYAIQYGTLLNKKENFKILMAIVNQAVISTKDIIFVCSKTEEEYQYLKLMGYFIEEKFRIKMLSYKKYKKLEGAPAKHIRYDIDNTRAHNLLVELCEDDKILKKNLKNELDRLEKKKLIAYCRNLGFTGIEKMKRKHLVEHVLEYMNKYILLK